MVHRSGESAGARPSQPSNDSRQRGGGLHRQACVRSTQQAQCDHKDGLQSRTGLVAVQHQLHAEDGNTGQQCEEPRFCRADFGDAFQNHDQAPPPAKTKVKSVDPNDCNRS